MVIIIFIVIKGRRYHGMVATMGWYGKYHGSPPQPVSHRNQHFVYKTITSEHLQSRAATNLLGALVFLPFTCVPRAMKPASSLFQFELAMLFQAHARTTLHTQWIQLSSLLDCSVASGVRIPPLHTTTPLHLYPPRPPRFRLWGRQLQPSVLLAQSSSVSGSVAGASSSSL